MAAPPQRPQRSSTLRCTACTPSRPPCLGTCLHHTSSTAPCRVLLRKFQRNNAARTGTLLCKQHPLDRMRIATHPAGHSRSTSCPACTPRVLRCQLGKPILVDTTSAVLLLWWDRPAPLGRARRTARSTGKRGQRNPACQQRTLAGSHPPAARDARLERCVPLALGWSPNHWKHREWIRVKLSTYPGRGGG